VLITTFLILAVAVGTAYAYFNRESSPYAPSMHDYLDAEAHDASDDETARAA
jgi:hypothetical protein